MPAQKLRKEKSVDALRSIGEAAGELGLQTHVLRYWEGKFPKQVKPIKRGDGRRMFRPQDMDALRAIQILVHERGMTLKGAKTLFAEQGISAVLSGSAKLIVANGGAAGVDLPATTPRPSPARDLQQVVSEAFGAELPEPRVTEVTGSPERLETVLGEMTSLKARLDAMRAQRAA